MTPHGEVTEKFPVVRGLGFSDHQVGVVAQRQRGPDEKVDGLGRLPETREHVDFAKGLEPVQPTLFSERAAHVLQTGHYRLETLLSVLPQSRHGLHAVPAKVVRTVAPLFVSVTRDRKRLDRRRRRRFVSSGRPVVAVVQRRDPPLRPHRRQVRVRKALPDPPRTFSTNRVRPGAATV